MGRATHAGLVFALFLLGLPAYAQQQSEAGPDGRLELLHEPISYTNVIDGFEIVDPFDLNISLGFVHSRTTGLIQREANTSAGIELVDIANHERVVNTLMLGMDIGLWKDLALFLRLPLILSDERNLQAPDGSTADSVNGDLCQTEPDLSTGTCAGGQGNQLFSVPFFSPTRSGIDYLGVGLAWSVFNQYRKPSLPTWLLRAETRISVTEPMHACEDTGSGLVCNDGFTDPGISRGTVALRLETRFSKRLRHYVEPYVGFLFQAEWPTMAKDYFAPSGLEGYVNTMPPRIAELTAGATVIPWEQQARHQRFAIDFRLKGAYVSQGRNYSPLFDALGTSSSGYLTEPNVDQPPNVAGTNSPTDVPFYGLTDNEAHGRLGGSLRFEIRAAKYIVFVAGLGMSFLTSHLITDAGPCNAGVQTGPDDARSRNCEDVGIIDPHHRPVVDLPGRRFRLDSAMTLDLFLRGEAQF